MGSGFGALGRSGRVLSIRLQSACSRKVACQSATEMTPLPPNILYSPMIKGLSTFGGKENIP